MNRSKIGGHWRREVHPGNSATTKSKILSVKPPPTPISYWGFKLLNKVGWMLFKTRYIREKKLFE